MSGMEFKITPHRAKILSILRQGDVEDPSGYASPILRKQTGHSTHNALAAVLLEMEKVGLVLRDMNGRRTYRITLTPKGRELADLLAGATAAARIGSTSPPVSVPEPHHRDTNLTAADQSEIQRLRARVAFLEDRLALHESMVDVLLDKLASRT